MTEPKTETSAAQPEAVQPAEQLLDLNRYQALYGRVFMAASSNPDLLNPAEILDPSIKIDDSLLDGWSKATSLGSRSYDFVISNLSVAERQNAWKGMDFNEAYIKWSGALRSSIILTTSESRKKVIELFLGKTHADITDDDIQKLYNTYCEGGSKITEFVKKAKTLDANEDLEWLAGKLFGKDSAFIIKGVSSLENVYENSKNKNFIPNLLWGENNRANNPSDEEKYYLGKLFNHLTEKYKSVKPAAQAPQTPTTPEPAIPTTTPTILEPPKPPVNPAATNPDLSTQPKFEVGKMIMNKSGDQFRIDSIKNAYSPYVEDSVSMGNSITLIDANGNILTINEKDLLKKIEEGEFGFMGQFKDKIDQNAASSDSKTDYQDVVAKEENKPAPIATEDPNIRPLNVIEDSDNPNWYRNTPKYVEAMRKYNEDKTAEVEKARQAVQSSSPPLPPPDWNPPANKPPSRSFRNRAKDKLRRGKRKFDDDE
jgi:hypothetical protein